MNGNNIFFSYSRILKYLKLFIEFLYLIPILNQLLLTKISKYQDVDNSTVLFKKLFYYCMSPVYISLIIF